VGQHLFLKVKSKKSSLKLGIFLKLVEIYCGPFKILEMIGPIEYMLAPLAPMCIHVIDWNVIQVEKDGDFRVQPICIVDMKVKIFRNQAIGLVKVQWTCYGPEDATW
jgi:hypothetical protein